MKIIFIGPAHPYRGGIAAFSERLAHEFQAQGHDVETETFTLQYPSFLFPGTSQYTDAPAPKDLRIQRSVHSCNPFNWIQVGRKIAKRKADMVIIMFWHPFMAPCLGTISRIIRRNKTTKVMAAIHNFMPHERQLGDKLFASYLTHSVDGFVAMSKSVLKDIELFDRENKPKEFAPHPLYDNFGTSVSREEAMKHLGLDPSKHYMLFFGFIRDYKGLDLLMEAFADPRFKEKDIYLMVTGEFYNNRDKYMELEKQLGLNGQIIWKSEFVADEEVKYYFNAADIIVQPYKSATQSGVTQIAYHFEKPMLVTNVGGLAEIVPQGKVGYVTEVNSKSIADALIDFYENNKAQAFAEHLKEEKKKYSWSNMVNAFIHAYKASKEKNRK